MPRSANLDFLPWLWRDLSKWREDCRSCECTAPKECLRGAFICTASAVLMKNYSKIFTSGWTKAKTAKRGTSLHLGRQKTKDIRRAQEADDISENTGLFQKRLLDKDSGWRRPWWSRSSVTPISGWAMVSCVVRLTQSNWCWKAIRSNRWHICYFKFISKTVLLKNGNEARDVLGKALPLLWAEIGKSGPY